MIRREQGPAIADIIEAATDDTDVVLYVHRLSILFLWDPHERVHLVEHVFERAILSAN